MPSLTGGPYSSKTEGHDDGIVLYRWGIELVVIVCVSWRFVDIRHNDHYIFQIVLNLVLQRMFHLVFMCGDTINSKGV